MYLIQFYVSLHENAVVKMKHAVLTFRLKKYTRLIEKLSHPIRSKIGSVLAFRWIHHRNMVKFEYQKQSVLFSNVT